MYGQHYAHILAVNDRLCYKMKNNAAKKIISALTIVIAIFLIWTLFIFVSFDVEKMQSDIESNYSTSLLDANGKLMDVFLNDDEQWHLKIEDDVQDNLKEAVITYEDKHFYNHIGVDIFAIARAFRDNLLGYKRSGASTITMQVAKLAYPKKRNYINKYIKKPYLSYI